MNVRHLAGYGLPTLVGLTAVAAFLVRLDREPYFVDEGAMVFQSAYWPLFRDGRVHDYRWLLYPAADHPPLSKYLFGLAQEWAGIRVPVDGYLARWAYWMAGGINVVRPERAALHAARVPSAVAGIVAALGIFWLGRRLGHWSVGMVAAWLWILTPLVRTHARRAMGDVITEAAVVLGLLAATAVLEAIWQSRRLRAGSWGALAAACVAAAALAKLNGGLVAVAVWLAFLLACLQSWQTAWKFWSLASLVCLLPLGAAILFALLNPFVTARPAFPEKLPSWAEPFALWRTEPELVRMGPVGRLVYLARFRAEVMRDGAELFPHDRLQTVRERLVALWIDGCGRFGPLAWRRLVTNARGETRVEFVPWKWSPWLWAPLVMLGLLSLVSRAGRQLVQGDLPTLLPMAIYAVLVVLVTATLTPLRWDRYYLPLQTVAVLVVPMGIASCLQWLRRGRSNDATTT